MVKGSISCLILALLGHTSLAQTTTTTGPSYQPSDAVAVPINPMDTFNATVFAYLYGAPIEAFAQLAVPILEEQGSNNISAGQALSSPYSQAVVRPNADTVYTTSILDLSQYDLEITIPNITDNRFWAFPFYDFYGNNFGSVSVAVGSPVGTYLIRRASDALVQPGIEYTISNALCPYPKYTGYINFPTTYGSLWNRILVRQNTTADLDIVHSYQRNISITPVPREISQPGTLPAPKLTAELFASNKTGTAKLLDLLARFAQFNQPEVLSDAYRVASILGLAGLAGGVYTPPADVNLTQVVGAVSANAALTTSTPKDTLVLGNGWYTGTSNISGNFGVDYAVRAYTAETGYLQLAEDIAIYPVYKSGPAGDALEGDEALLFTFSGRPPVNVDGFWSLTLYGENQYFVPNPLSRYEIGDRTTSLRFNNGGLVYGANASRTDGPFQVLIQPQNMVPPTNWTGNWLPAAIGGGNMSFTMRWYGTQNPAFTNGSYVYPTVQKIDAIV